MTDVAVAFVRVPQAFAGTLQSPAPMLHMTPRLFSSLLTVAFKVIGPEAAGIVLIALVIVTAIGPVTDMVKEGLMVVPFPVAETVAVTAQPLEGMLLAAGGV